MGLKTEAYIAAWKCRLAFVGGGGSLWSPCATFAAGPRDIIRSTRAVGAQEIPEPQWNGVLQRLLRADGDEPGFPEALQISLTVGPTLA
ncbi:hypothetical protein NDU88_004523 [Pleurodeles waltl]|uniref:Uncharacterized protein n=1 Tax=Pleurodeles waltl TaxID=8319 RepID=A0AAV7NSR1_PLEWA|nr:hypothetical protein NDU88_004523 [Pleurodeles waltl]